MTYSKTTDEILRELNEFIAKAKETAATARKCEIPWYKEFWGSIADRTDKMTDDLRRTLTRVSDIADHPDKITSHFNIISAIDDAAFFSNIIAFHAGLTISRGQPENYKAMWPLCERYRDLAMMLVKKIFKIQQFLKELSALIFEDMRKTVAAKLTDASQKAKSAADMIQGYDYIKSELLNLLDALNTKSDVTEKDLEMLLFRLKIIELPAETDMLRNKNRTMLDGMEPLRKSLEEARDFVLSLPKPQKDEPVNIIDILQNIAYQGNILLFYTRGEIEKLDISLTAEQKAATERICVSISEFVKLTQNAADSTAFRQIAGVMREVKNDMRILADTLSDHGGAFSFLCGELESFDGKMLACADDYDKKNAAV